MDNPNAIADAQNLVSALNERKKYWESVKNVPTARAAQAEEERKKKEAENSLPPLPENVTIGEDGSLQAVDNNEEKEEEPTTGVGEPPMDEENADVFVAAMEDNAEEDPNISLTPEAWVESFGAFNSLETPIGRVKMGENQYAKLEEKKRTREFGMVVQTLRNPDVVFIEQSEAKEGQTTERPYSLVFIKTFVRDGEKIRYYSSVTVSKDGMEISVSSHYTKPTKVKEKLTSLRRYYTNEALFSNSSEWHLAEQQDNAVPDLLPTQENNASASEDTTSEEEMQESAQENADKAQEIDAASTAQQAEEQNREERKQMLENMSIEELEKEIERIRNFNHPIFTMTEEEKGKKIADKNWVLTAYDLSASDGSSAITTTNQGEAAPATDKSASKDTAKTSDSQEDEKKRTEKDKGNTSNFDFDEIEALKDAPRSVRTAIRDYAVNAYNRAMLKVPAFQFGIPEEKQERMTFEKFRDEFNDYAEIFAKGTEKYLPAVYEYINKQLDAKTQEKAEEKTQDVQDKTKQNDSEGKQEEKKPQKPTSNRKKRKTKSDLIDELGQPANVREWIMRFLYRREYKFIWDSNGKTKGLGQHLGLADSKAERKSYFWMLAGKDKGGMYPESVSEAMTEQINDDLGLTGEARVNSIDVLNELLDVVGSYSSQSRMFDAIFDIHKGIEDGISDEEAEYLGNESLAKSWGFDSFAEYEQYREAVEQLAGMNELSEDEYTELQSLYYDYYYGQENDGRVQEGQ